MPVVGEKTCEPWDGGWNKNNSPYGSFCTEIVQSKKSWSRLIILRIKFWGELHLYTQKIKKEASQKFVQLMRSFFMLEIC
jgi:hypothetical protein